jgi:hypothetical protein
MTCRNEVAPLSERELDKIIRTIPEVRDRAKMMSHLSVTRSWNKPADERDAIVSWINRTWTSETVRAKMARKVASLIELGRHMPL